MFEHVVVPLDGSTFAETAIPLALEVAKRAGARIELVSVREPAPSTAYPEWENLAREWTGSYLERVSERFTGEGLTVTETLLFGPVAASLAEHIDEAGGDLVIMATHGRSAMTRAWLGSVADAFLRASSCPVLLVRPDDSEESGGREQVEHLEHILVPLDDSELSHAILGPVLALGELFDAHYTLVRAVIVPMELSSPYLPHTVQMNHDLLEEARASAEEMIQREAAALRERGHHVEAVVKVDGQAARVILQVAGERECGVVALATHGRGGVTRMLLGSTADKVIRGSHHPVLVIRPGGMG